MWWAGLLAVIFLFLGLRPPKNRAALQVLTLAAIAAVLLVAYLRLPTSPSPP